MRPEYWLPLYLTIGIVIGMAVGMTFGPEGVGLGVVGGAAVAGALYAYFRGRG